ncbi:P-loop containing nucleoside triphosphate hydrolase protein [Rhizophagus clarus]|uniref:RNA helicase n=1 Tax=Rhizophagus clarus TaxID=94130 RepID=A0A8H3M9J3_9GLOM|nr:P-loop containing nucleoside triphosphate hydrolase protein [Rhizophagus clarus]
MPPKGKSKKKKQINSARAFSTTSTPSKNKEALKNEIESQVSSPIPEPSTTELTISSEQTNLDNVEENINEEESYLNSIIEKYQDLDSKKVDAYFKDSQELIGLGNESQVLRLDSNIEHKILNFIKEMGYQELDQSRNLYTSNLSQEHIISSLNKLYLILLRLGFSKENIKECLRNINGEDIKAALDWLCIHLSSEDLPAGFVDKIYYEKGMDISVTRSTSPTSQSPIKKGDDVSKEKEPSEQNSSSKPKPKRSSIVENDIKDWILNSLRNDASDDSEPESGTTYQPLSLALKHATLKRELVLQNKILSVLKKLNRGQEKQEQANQRIDELQKEIKNFEELNSYEFNRDEAENEFKNLMKYKDLDKEVKEILGDEIEDVKEQDKTEIDEGKQVEGDQKKGINDDDDDDLFGGLLDNVPDDSTASESNISSTIIMRDMIPKTFTGKLPKDQLKEFCRKKDDKVQISFNKICDGNLYKCSLKIRWSYEKKGQDKEWNMGKFACRRKDEAENYVATLALFELTDLPIYLTFPTFYRELWLELTEEKKSAENKIKLAGEQERIKLLIDVIEEKKKGNIIRGKSKTSDELNQEQIYKDKSNIKQYNIVDNKTSSEGEAMKKAFLNRQKNKSYMDMLEKRKQLPIYSYRDQFLEKLSRSQVVIVSGETGCGKSTQIPQFITEDMLMSGYGDKCNVICTQPRRISAISIAQRVSAEIGDLPRTIGTSKALVGYQIRLESKVARENVLTFCTYGILLRRLESDKLLKNVSHVIIDEVHERSLESDFLMIILKKIFERRSDLKVILMSATVNASKFSRYFENCPIIEIPGKIFPVEVKFLEDVIEETDYMIDLDDEFARKIYRQIKDEGTVTITGKGQTSHTIKLQYEEDMDDSYTDLNIPQEYLEQYSKRTHATKK